MVKSSGIGPLRASYTLQMLSRSLFPARVPTLRGEMNAWAKNRECVLFLNPEVAMLAKPRELLKMYKSGLPPKDSNALSSHAGNYRHSHPPLPEVSLPQASVTCGQS